MKLKWLAIGLLVFAGGYVAAAFATQAKLAADTSIEYGGYKVLSLGSQRAQVLITLLVTNKSAFSFSVFNQSYEVAVNGNKVADVSEWRQTLVPKQSTTPVELLVEFSPRNMLSTIWQQIITSLGNAQINLKGKISVRTLGAIVARIPVNETFELKNFKIQ